MKKILTVPLLLLIIFTPEIYTQNQSILIYDPYGVSGGFQFSFSILSDDSVFTADTIDNSIKDHDALFLFLGNPYELNEEEGNRLTTYLQSQKPIYLFTDLFTANIDSVDFWNFIGLDDYAEGALMVLVDSVIGVKSEFTNGVSIDTSFWSPGIPWVQGNLISILIGEGNPLNIDVAYISGYDSIKIIVDQYFQIHHLEFLDEVLIYFGLKDPNGIADYEIKIADDFILSQNYPNPFNPTTKIKFSIPTSPLNPSPYQGEGNRERFVSLIVYDVLGNKIATLVNEEKPAGSYEVEFDASDLSSGIYFYRLQAGNYIETKKMVLLC